MRTLLQWGRGDDKMPRVKPDDIEFEMQPNIQSTQALVYVRAKGKLIFSCQISFAGVEVRKRMPKTVGIKVAFNIFTKLVEWLKKDGWGALDWLTVEMANYAIDKGYIQQCYCCQKRRARVMEEVQYKGYAFKVCSRHCRREFWRITPELDYYLRNEGE